VLANLKSEKETIEERLAMSHRAFCEKEDQLEFERDLNSLNVSKLRKMERNE